MLLVCFGSDWAAAEFGLVFSLSLLMLLLVFLLFLVLDGGFRFNSCSSKSLLDAGKKLCSWKSNIAFAISVERSESLSLLGSSSKVAVSEARECTALVASNSMYGKVPQEKLSVRFLKTYSRISERGSEVYFQTSLCEFKFTYQQF